MELNHVGTRTLKTTRLSCAPFIFLMHRLCLTTGQVTRMLLSL